MFLQYLKKFGYFGCLRPSGVPTIVQPEASHAVWCPLPPTNVPPFMPIPPEAVVSNPDCVDSVTDRPPWPPGRPPFGLLPSTPLHTVLSSLQFSFANAGLAARILVVKVATAIIAQ